MFGCQGSTVRKLSSKEVIRCFLKQLHLCQSERLAQIPKILLDRNWKHGTGMFVNLSANTDWTMPISELEHRVIIPSVYAMLQRIELKIADCDVLVFHALPVSKGMWGYRESLDGISARIVDSLGVSPVPAFRIDISFTPLWLRKVDDECLYHVGEV